MHNIRFIHLLPVAPLVAASCGGQPAAPSPTTPPPPVNTAAPQASPAPRSAGLVEPTVLSEDKDAGLIEKFDPRRDFDKIVTPLFVDAGQNDQRVPRSVSEQVVGALPKRERNPEWPNSARRARTV